MFLKLYLSQEGTSLHQQAQQFQDIYNIIKTFLKDSGIISDFTCERKEENNNNNNNKISNGNIDINNNEQLSNININNSDNNININLDENKNESNMGDNINDNDKNANIIVYYIGFPSPDIAFDFNRYMN